MSQPGSGEFSEVDLGRVVEVDSPEGVSWMSFGGIFLEMLDATAEGEAFDIVPVSTRELDEAKHDDVTEGDWFFAQVNLAATSQSDVNPREFEYIPPKLRDLPDEFDWKN
jgi:hypothetical protein